MTRVKKFFGIVGDSLQILISLIIIFFVFWAFPKVLARFETNTDYGWFVILKMLFIIILFIIFFVVLSLSILIIKMSLSILKAIFPKSKIILKLEKGFIKLASKFDIKV